MAYSRLEERRAAFQKQVKEQSMSVLLTFMLTLIEGLAATVSADKMREIISTLPADVDTLIAKLERKFEDVGKGDGSAMKIKRHERTVEGALTELQP